MPELDIFERGMEKLTEFYNRKQLTQRQRFQWFDKVGHLTDNQFRNSIDHITSTSRYFPTPAELLNSNEGNSTQDDDHPVDSDLCVSCTKCQYSKLGKPTNGTSCLECANLDRLYSFSQWLKIEGRGSSILNKFLNKEIVFKDMSGS